MRSLAEGVHQLSGFPPNAINVYLVDDALVDAGTRSAKRRILRQLSGRKVSTHVLTHGHPDHYGSSHEICEQLGLPLWCGEADAQAVETGSPVLPDSKAATVMRKMPLPPGHPVARRLREGDRVGSFAVLETPGHSAGHISLWRESDRVLILGDVFFNVRGVSKPPDFLTIDPARNRASMRRLAELEPALVLFGHGPPLRDPRRLAEAAAG